MQRFSSALMRNAWTASATAFGSRSAVAAATSSLPTAWSTARNIATTPVTQDKEDLLKQDYSSPDNYFHENQLPKGNTDAKRAHTYFVLGGGRFMMATTARLAVLKFVATMSAAADVLALASIEVELGKVAVGQTITVKWRGKPVFIRNRTADEVAEANSVDVSGLRDPQTDAERVRGEPNWLVVLGICTHLGCVPISDAGEYGGWFCPCHGSHYDISGRIRKGPAPLNLEVPPYAFIDDKLRLG